MGGHRVPRCFQNPADARRWVSSARYAPAGHSSFCVDCTARFQKEMIAQGLCDHPDVKFMIDPQDGHVVGVKPKDPAQAEMFEVA